jgi:hypothetical protein
MVALLAGCSLVLGDLPPTSGELAGSGGGGANGGSGTGGASGGTGQGGAGATGGASSGTGGTQPNCDQDGDGFKSDVCEGGVDCNDANDDVNPDQIAYQTEPHNQDGSFDWNCDRVTEKDGPVVECPAVAPEACPMEQGFLDDVACGFEARWGACTEDATGLGCAAEVITERLRRGCR